LNAKADCLTCKGALNISVHALNSASNAIAPLEREVEEAKVALRNGELLEEKVKESLRLAERKVDVAIEEAAAAAADHESSKVEKKTEVRNSLFARDSTPSGRESVARNREATLAQTHRDAGIRLKRAQAAVDVAKEKALRASKATESFKIALDYFENGLQVKTAERRACGQRRLAAALALEEAEEWTVSCGLNVNDRSRLVRCVEMWGSCLPSVELDVIHSQGRTESTMEAVNINTNTNTNPNW